ncbi:MAG: hypothetical protein UU49_C0015G0007 [Candidatus Magasanikbacteria bacterium GW2011_GWC2_41_17]|uniref:3D domain-containing protein n=1 Tax=Candidatus Magasanikbacteria bacterium GW2011_GWC2_41_17 TaxID=1619048 RepID=A0A0G0YER4_9BACT|nr:MAG: hypothetical protein UU49_C0015G0007 [Candidatus Magasanikbacteria bacterium GW2011_GWC2_41_17]
MLYFFVEPLKGVFRLNPMRYSKLFKFTFPYKLAIILALISIVFDSSFPRLAQAQGADLSNLETIGQLPLANDREATRTIKVVLTAYSSTPNQTDSTPFITANNKQVYDGLIAANWLKFGTRVKFPELFGDKIFTVNDRMHSRFGRGRVDLWLDLPLDEVKAFGVKRVVMEMY